jgi:serine phosphatase RsbU (regulator of sigma subunit)
MAMASAPRAKPTTRQCSACKATRTRSRFDLVRARPTGDGSEVGATSTTSFQIGINDWVVAVSDVCGEGIEAAVVTALARYTLPAAIVEHAEPSTALATLNEVLLHHHTNHSAPPSCCD